MGIANYKCLECNHFIVCKIKEKIDVFHEDAKKNLGVDLTMDSCCSFEKAD